MKHNEHRIKRTKTRSVKRALQHVVSGHWRCRPEETGLTVRAFFATAQERDAFIQKCRQAPFSSEREVVDVLEAISSTPNAARTYEENMMSFACIGWLETRGLIPEDNWNGFQRFAVTVPIR